MVEAGEVAFLKHTTVVEMITTEQFGTIKVAIFQRKFVEFCLTIIIHFLFIRLMISSFCVWMERVAAFENTATAIGDKFLEMPW